MGSDSGCPQVSSSVIPLYTFPQVVVTSSIPSTPPRPDVPQPTDEHFRNRSTQSVPHHFYAVDLSADIILEQRSTGHPLCRRFHTAVSHRLDGPGLHHFIGTTQASGPQTPATV